MARTPRLDHFDTRRLHVLETERDALAQLQEERFGPLLREARRATTDRISRERRADRQLALDATTGLPTEGTDRWPASNTL